MKWLLVLALLSGLTAADKKKKVEYERATPPPSLPDQSVQSEDGTFTFSALRVKNVYGLEYLDGVVFNQTTRNWENLTFYVQCVGSAGTKLCGVISVGSLNSGLSAPLAKYGDGVIITAPAGVTRWWIEMATGSYPAKYSVSMVKPEAKPDLLYKQDGISIVFVPTKTGIHFAISNGSDKVLKLNWNEAALTGLTGNSMSVTHEGVKFTDARSVKPPSVVPPGATFSDTAIPAENIEFTSGKYGGWSVKPMLPDGPRAKGMGGLTFGLYLPMDLDGKSIAKAFTFKIEKVEF